MAVALTSQRYQARDVAEAIELCFDKGWSDGLPVIPPTENRVVAMLEAGFGITTLPWYAFPQGNTRLTFIPLHTPEITRHVGIIQLNNKSLTPPAQALVDFILASRTD